MSKDQRDVSHIDKGKINKPIAYCVDLEEDALIEASKILGLDPTDVNFLDTPLYTHPMRDLTDKEIYDLSQFHLVAKIGSCGEATGDIDGEIDFARAIIKASRGEK